jgi:hypothetical protein
MTTMFENESATPFSQGPHLRGDGVKFPGKQFARIVAPPEEQARPAEAKPEVPLRSPTIRHPPA